VRLPGERRQGLAEESMREGIAVPAPLHAQLKALARA
jgi:LDH2 family malate/lactate/ureidoglycolate dehydrogenase